MASPQLENGYLKIAYELVEAMIRYGFTSLEYDILIAVMLLTYGANKTKAQMSIDDIRYQLGERRNVRNDRLTKAIDGLVEKSVLYKQTINQNGFLLGIQKDYEKWGGAHRESVQNGQSINRVNIHISNNTTINRVHKMDTLPKPPARLLEYVENLSSFKYTTGARLQELKMARKLYTEAVQLTRSPVDAAYALKDYFDQLYEEEWIRAHVKFPLTYAYSRFAAWYKSIPRKPREIREEEEYQKRRWRYNFKKKNWERTNDRLS